MYKPDGTPYQETKSAKPPLHLVVPRGEAGNWTYEVIDNESKPHEPWVVVINTIRPSTQTPKPFFVVPPPSKPDEPPCAHGVTAGQTDSWKVTARDAAGKPAITASGLPSWGSFTDNGNGTGTVTFNPPSDTPDQVIHPTFTASLLGLSDTLTECTESVAALGKASSVGGTVSGGPGAGVTLSLDPGGSVAVTGSGGGYGFTGLGAGTYTVTLTVPSGYTASGATSVTRTVDGTNSAVANFALTKVATVAATPTPTPTPTPPPPLAMATVALTNSSVGAPYDPALTASGGTPPYTFAVTGLPAGLSATSSGEVSGTPTQSGTFNLAVTVTDSSVPAQTASGTVTMTVASQPQVGPAPSTPSTDPFIVLDPFFAGYADVGAPFSTALTAVGGVGPYSWSIVAGALPAGVALSGSSLTGTPTTAGSFDVVVQVKDSFGAATTRWVDMQVAATMPSIVTSSLFGAILNQPYGRGIQATGGSECVGFGLCGYAFSIVGGTANLPPGITMDSGGLFSGSPLKPGRYPFTVAATDLANVTVQQPESITVFQTPLTIASGPLTFTVGAAANFSLSTITTGADPATYSWGATTPDFGASISDFGLAFNGGPSATITGTPNAAGTFDIAVSATSATDPGDVTQIITVNLVPAVTPPQITTTKLPLGERNAAYSATLQTNSSSTSLVFADLGTPNGVTGPGQLGLSIRTSGTGAIISGTPTNITKLNVGFFFPSPILWKIQVTDAQTGLSSTSDVEISIVEAFRMDPSITDIVGQPTTSSFNLSGPFPPYTCTGWTKNPPGLSVSSNCAISGTPTVAGTYAPQVTITDSSQPVPLTVTFNISSWVVASGPPPLIAFISNSNPGALAGVPLLDQRGHPIVVTASKGSGTYSYSLQATTGTAAVPSWLSVDQSTGTLTGTPPSGTQGTFNLQVTVGDGGVSPPVLLPFTLMVDARAPSATAPTWYGEVGTPFSKPLPVSGGTLPYRYGIVFCGGDAGPGAGPTPSSGGSIPLTGCAIIPAGLALDATGALSGTPTAAGVGEIAYAVTDAAGFATLTDFHMFIGGGAPSITAAAPPNATSGTPYTAYSFAASGGIGTYRWSVGSGCALAAGATPTVPPGLTWDAFGHLTGVPTAPGTYAWCAVVTDAAGVSSAASPVQMSVAAAAAPAPSPSPTPTPSPSATP